MSESEKSICDSKENVLKELLLTYGIESTENQRRQLLKHIELLIEINKNLNLTRITSIDDALVLHILDSLLPLKACNEFISGTHNYIDIGTGGGFPGLPLAIMSDNKTLLVDSIGKKINAVESELKSFVPKKFQMTISRSLILLLSEPLQRQIFFWSTQSLS